MWEWVEIVKRFWYVGAMDCLLFLPTRMDEASLVLKAHIVKSMFLYRLRIRDSFNGKTISVTVITVLITTCAMVIDK